MSELPRAYQSRLWFPSLSNYNWKLTAGYLHNIYWIWHIDWMPYIYMAHSCSICSYGQVFFLLTMWYGCNQGRYSHSRQWVVCEWSIPLGHKLLSVDLSSAALLCSFLHMTRQRLLTAVWFATGRSRWGRKSYSQIKSEVVWPSSRFHIDSSGRVSAKYNLNFQKNEQKEENIQFITNQI